MADFQTKIWVKFEGNCNGRCWYFIWTFGLYFTAIWYVLLPFWYMYLLFFGTFSPFWYVVPIKIWQPWSHLQSRLKIGSAATT
jgi:hypothetical protein